MSQVPEIGLPLVRHLYHADYTLGMLTLPSGFKLATIERPWKNNAANVSCIPEGLYNVAITLSAKFRRYMYEVLNVPNRAGIRIHSANWAVQLHGCIAVGLAHGPGCVLQSAMALRRLNDELDGAAFKLRITSTNSGAH